MFSKEQRGTFKYWFAHWSAYQMTALNLGCWKFKYLFHDVTKPWMLCWAKVFHRADPYAWVQRKHRSSSAHHLEAYNETEIRTVQQGKPHSTIIIQFPDVQAMLIDWECSRFTKQTEPRNAFEEYMSIEDSLPHHFQCKIESELQMLGLWPYESAVLTEHQTDLDVEIIFKK